MKTSAQHKRIMRTKRHRRIRATISGTAVRPRLSIFRSNRHVFAQLIDDAHGVTLISMADRDKALAALKRLDRAREIGKLLATKAKEKGITTVVFDRGGYAYHGIVKALADGAREGGLKF